MAKVHSTHRPQATANGQEKTGGTHRSQAMCQQKSGAAVVSQHIARTVHGAKPRKSSIIMISCTGERGSLLSSMYGTTEQTAGCGMVPSPNYISDKIHAFLAAHHTCLHVVTACNYPRYVVVVFDGLTFDGMQRQTPKTIP